MRTTYSTVNRMVNNHSNPRNIARWWRRIGSTLSNMTTSTLAAISNSRTTSNARPALVSDRKITRQSRSLSEFGSTAGFGSGIGKDTDGIAAPRRNVENRIAAAGQAVVPTASTSPSTRAERRRPWALEWPVTLRTIQSNMR